MRCLLLRNCWLCCAPALLIVVATAHVGRGDEAPPAVQTLFDFESADEVQAWSVLEVLGAAPEPAPRIEQSTEHATSGQHSLKITFAGGHWPAISTRRIPADWMPYWKFQADVTVERPCVVGFAAMQEKSRRGGGWDEIVSRWTKTEQLHAGKNVITGSLHDSNNYSINTKNGPVVSFEIFMYNPHEDESIYVDNIRISTDKDFPPAAKPSFRVLGTDWVVSSPRELGEKLRDRWQPPTPKDVPQIEADFRARYAELKAAHPGAVMAIFRDGQAGYDPAHPAAVYAGWKDAYWTSHGPDGMFVERAQNTGDRASHEIFMRHRSPLMQVDLSSIPTRAKILAAELLVVCAPRPASKDHHPGQPNMWVAEPCNRDWDELEVNAFQYAKDKFWKSIGGMHWQNDADFLPIYLAYGPSQGDTNVWDFTEAVRYWTDGNANHGFMLHGNGGDYVPHGFSREAEKVADRPALLVIYEPAK